MVSEGTQYARSWLAIFLLPLPWMLMLWLIPKKKAQSYSIYFVPVAVAALISIALFDLLPEAYVHFFERAEELPAAHEEHAMLLEWECFNTTEEYQHADLITPGDHAEDVCLNITALEMALTGEHDHGHDDHRRLQHDDHDDHDDHGDHEDHHDHDHHHEEVLKKAKGSVMALFLGLFIGFFTETSLHMVLEDEHDHGDGAAKNPNPDSEDQGKDMVPLETSTDEVAGQSAKNYNKVFLLVAANAIHYFADGIVIGTNAGREVGKFVAIVSAQMAHEIGISITLFGVYIGCSLGKRMAMAVLLSCNIIFKGIGAMVGVGVGAMGENQEYVFAAASGLFLYIALGDLLPELSHYRGSTKDKAILFCLALVTFGLFYLLFNAMPHEH